MLISIPRLGVLISWVLMSTGANLKADDTVYVGRKQAPKLSMNQVDHALWNHLLTTYVDEDGQVDYKSWKANANDTRRLDLYLSHLSSANSRQAGSKQAKLAFWINAYNAVTVRGILREYPTTSIRNHTAKLWGYNIWKDLKLYVGADALSLDQIEHEILRKMSEPRIHFAIVCASVGCPRLLNEAYVADRLESQLEANAKDFFARRQNFQFDAQRNRVGLSSILDWFGADFGDSEAAVLKRISQWLPSSAAEAARRGGLTVSYLDYDWSLNSQ